MYVRGVVECTGLKERRGEIVGPDPQNSIFRPRHRECLVEIQHRDGYAPSLVAWQQVPHPLERHAAVVDL